MSMISNDKDIFNGIGQFRTGHLIQLSALLGLLPLDFYVYVPLHTNGGTGNFINKYMMTGVNAVSATTQQPSIDDKMILFTDSEMKRLQSLFNNNFTGNMLENTACIIGRTMKKKDVFYYLPWYDPVKKELTNANSLQLMFYITCPRGYEYVLMANDGTAVMHLKPDSYSQE